MKVHTTILCAIISFGFDVIAAPAPAAEPDAGAAPALEARSGERLGGIDMDWSCKDQYGLGWEDTRNGDSCNAWSCKNSIYKKSVDTPRACSVQYGPNVYAYCSTGWDNWSCFRA
jgi:hypothetical protein